MSGVSIQGEAKSCCRDLGWGNSTPGRNFEGWRYRLQNIENLRKEHNGTPCIDFSISKLQTAMDFQRQRMSTIGVAGFALSVFKSVQNDSLTRDTKKKLVLLLKDTVVTLTKVKNEKYENSGGSFIALLQNCIDASSSKVNPPHSISFFSLIE